MRGLKVDRFTAALILLVAVALALSAGPYIKPLFAQPKAPEAVAYCPSRTMGGMFVPCRYVRHPDIRV